MASYKKIIIIQVVFVILIVIVIFSYLHGHDSVIAFHSRRNLISQKFERTEEFMQSYRYSKLPILFVYTLVPKICRHGLPDYILTSLQQAVFTQPDCDIIMATNYRECPNVKIALKKVTNIIFVDINDVISSRTISFRNASFNLFQSDNHGELWITSALRFFIMEDVMRHLNYSEMFHVEADNMLYGKISDIIPILRSSYISLAATPLTASLLFVTASVFWINNKQSLIKFNDYLMDIVYNRTDIGKRYKQWLRKFACCNYGGIDPDKNGLGIKPFAINEMSLLAYFHYKYPKNLTFFPVVPTYDYIKNRYVINISDFAPGGLEVLRKFLLYSIIILIYLYIYFNLL